MSWLLRAALKRSAPRISHTLARSKRSFGVLQPNDPHVFNSKQPLITKSVYMVAMVHGLFWAFAGNYAAHFFLEPDMVIPDLYEEDEKDEE